MESNFNNGTPPAAGNPSPPAAESATPATADSPLSASLIRFRSCRWMQPAEGTGAEFCTHREVKPYAGTTSFDASAWCLDCVHYKLRRVPKKRSPEDYTY